MLLHDRIAIVTGAGSGIGAATASAFARQGARVVAVDLVAEAVDGVAEAIRSDGGEVITHVTDAGDPDQLDALFQFVDREFGRLDVLHNNHVWCENGMLGEISLEGFRRSLDVGVTSYFYSTKLALPLMLGQGGGAIVNTASICGLAGDFTVGAYNVLKAGVVNLTRATALDYARLGIRCNAVCPGPTFTRPYQLIAETNPGFVSDTAAAVPMGRLAEPAEIADGVVFLASDMARFITGTTLVIDGGLTAWTGLPSVGASNPGLD